MRARLAALLIMPVMIPETCDEVKSMAASVANGMYFERYLFQIDGLYSDGFDE
jgi:hypothetical protein